MKSIYCVLFFFLHFVVHTSLCESLLTTGEVPLYIRQSWIKLTEPIRSACICESGVNPTLAFKSMMNTEIASNPCLKCYYKCLHVKLNLIEATTGAFVEKEFLRQIEGVTPEIFKKCNEQTKDEVDLCKKTFDMYLCVVHAVAVPKLYPPLPPPKHH